MKKTALFVAALFCAAALAQEQALPAGPAAGQEPPNAEPPRLFNLGATPAPPPAVGIPAPPPAIGVPAPPPAIGIPAPPPAVGVPAPPPAPAPEQALPEPEPPPAPPPAPPPPPAEHAATPVQPAAEPAAQTLPRIAVYVTGNIGEDEKKALGTRMLTSFINSKRYRGIERSNSFLAEIEKEQVKQRSGDIDDSQISALGRQFGVKFICIADITPAFGAFQVSARVINVETAEIDFIGDASSPLKTLNDLAKVSETVVKKMFNDPKAPKVSKAPETPRAPGKKKNRISFGAGGFFESHFGGGVKWGYGEEIAMPYYGGGGYAYFDLIYAELSAGISGGGGKWQSNYATDLPDMQRTYMNYSLLLKWPFGWERVRIFPLAGFEIEQSISAKYDYGPLDAGDLTEGWLKFGAGADVNLTQRAYVRVEALYGLRTDGNRFEYDFFYGEPRPNDGLTLKAGFGMKIGKVQ